MAAYDWAALGRNAENLSIDNDADRADAYWKRMAQQYGPGAATSMRLAKEREQLGDTPAALSNRTATITPDMLAADPAQIHARVPDALRPPPADMVSQPQIQPPEAQIQTQQTQQQTPMQPPGMIPIQQTVSGISLPPKLLAKQELIEQKALAAQDALTEAQVAQNTLLAEQARAQAAEVAAANQRAATQQAYDAEQQQAKQAELQKAVDDYNANKTVNPNRAYERMGVGGRILATIGQAFGAFGAAITHSPNFAQQMIERAIDADIRAQEHDIASRGHAINMAQNTVAQFRQKGLDNQASMAAARLQGLQASAAKVDEIMAATKNPQIIAQGQQIKAGLEKSYNDTMMHYGQKQVSTVKANPAAAGPKSMDDQLRLRALEVDVPQVDPKTGKEAGSKTFIAKSPGDAEKIRQAIVVAGSIKKNIKMLRDFMQKTSVHSVGKNATKIETAADDLRTQFGVLRGLGALSDKDYKIASQIGDPSSMFQRDSTTYDLMDAFENRTDATLETELRGRGLIQ